MLAKAVIAKASANTILVVMVTLRFCRVRHAAMVDVSGPSMDERPAWSQIVSKPQLA
jgi:hypothetical protein